MWSVLFPSRIYYRIDENRTVFPSSETVVLPWHLKTEERDFIQAAKWSLSNAGGKIWSETHSDVFVVDPQGLVDFQTLLEAFKEPGSGWEPDDVLIAPRCGFENDGNID